MIDRRKIIVGLTVAFLFGVSVISVASLIRPARDISISIAGDEGQEVDATFVIDGKTREETLTTPVTRKFNASKLHFWITRDADLSRPILTVETKVDGRTFGTATAVAPTQCAYGGICTASLFSFRRERSYTDPVPKEIVVQRITPPGFPAP